MIKKQIGGPSVKTLAIPSWIIILLTCSSGFVDAIPANARFRSPYHSLIFLQRFVNRGINRKRLGNNVNLGQFLIMRCALEDFIWQLKSPSYQISGVSQKILSNFGLVDQEGKIKPSLRQKLYDIQNPSAEAVKLALKANNPYDYELFKTVLDIYYSIISNKGKPIPVPVFWSGQTAQGIFLRFYDGLPRSLQTPWGMLNLDSNEPEWKEFLQISDSAKDIPFSIAVKPLLHKLALSFCGYELWNNPIYKITQFDGQLLPKAIRADEHESTLEEIEKAWDYLISRYNGENSYFNRLIKYFRPDAPRVKH